MLSKEVNVKKLSKENREHTPVYSGRYLYKRLPKYELPEESVSPRTAYQLIKDELHLDGQANLNLASFVTTWMEPEAECLIKETLNKNFVDRDEYPQSQVIQERCVNILARLFNAPEGESFVGTGTIGSSEAVMLGGLSYKWKWRDRRKKENKDYSRPNIVMSTGVQVVWLKFAKYFDVEARLIPVKERFYTFPPKELANYVDENSIAVVGILGVTETGQFDPIKEINDTLLKINKKNGWDVPVHVDAASGGFIAPFIYPKLKWDFRLPLVKGINVSGHKYGLVYPGIGWIIWRDENQLPEDLIFHINYLGGNQPTFTLNFSKGSSHILAQYYNFLRLGREGYRKIVQSLHENALYIGKSLVDSGKFELLSDSESLPVVTARLKEDPHRVFAISDDLRKKGWIVPAYTMPPDAEQVQVLRVVVREGLSRDMADLLLKDIFEILQGRKLPEKEGPPEKQHKLC